jgi:hypothetical protein
MKTLTTAMMCACVALATGGAAAQDATKKDDPMAKDGKTITSMTMQECKDHMAMSTKEGMKKDDAMMKKDAMCADLAKKDGKKDGTSGEPVKK